MDECHERAPRQYDYLRRLTGNLFVNPLQTEKEV